MFKATKFAPLLVLAVLFGCGDGDDGGGGSAPVINSFSANPATVAAAGQTVQLSWSVSGSPTGLSIDNGVGAVSGNSVNVIPSATTTYTLTATNSSGQSDTETTTVTVGGTLPGPGVEDGLPPSGTFGVSLTQTGPFQSDVDGNITSASDSRVVSVAGGGTFYASVSYTDPGGISAISVRIANQTPAGLAADLTPGTAVGGFTIGAEVTGCVLDGTQTSVTCVYPITVAAGTPNISSLTPTEFAYVFRTNVTDAAGNRSDSPPRGYVVVGSGGGTSTTGGGTTTGGGGTTTTGGGGTTTTGGGGTTTTGGGGTTTTGGGGTTTGGGGGTTTTTGGGTGQTKIDSFNPSATKVNFGGAVNFNWKLSGVVPSAVRILQEGTNAVVAADLVGKTSFSGYKPLISANYILEVTASGGQVLRSTVTVAVAPVITTFTASPDNVPTNGTTKLDWVVGGPITEITLSGGGVNQTFTASGSYTATVTTSATYTLVAKNGAASNSKTVSVTSGPDITSFTITPSSVAVGGGVTLQWAISNFTSGQIVLTNPNGSTRTFPANARTVTLNNVQTNQGGQYTLRVENDAGDDDTATATLTVQ